MFVYHWNQFQTSQTRHSLFNSSLQKFILGRIFSVFLHLHNLLEPTMNVGQIRCANFRQSCCYIHSSGMLWANAILTENISRCIFLFSPYSSGWPTWRNFVLRHTWFGWNVPSSDDSECRVDNCEDSWRCRVCPFCRPDPLVAATSSLPSTDPVLLLLCYELPMEVLMKIIKSKKN